MGQAGLLLILFTVERPRDTRLRTSTQQRHGARHGPLESVDRRMLRVQQQFELMLRRLATAWLTCNFNMSIHEPHFGHPLQESR